MDFSKEAIENRIEEIKRKRVATIVDLLAQIDKLQARINAEKKELKEELQNTFLHLETEALTLPSPQKEEALQAIEECKLKSLELLGILAETTEAAMIAALERGENIQETIAEIAKDFTYESLGYEVDRRRIEDVAATILEVAANLATASPNYSEEILKGTILGIKQGITKSIEKFNEVLEFTPKEARDLLIVNYDSIASDLEHADLIYKEILLKVAQKSDPGIKEKIERIANENIFDRLTETAQKALENLKSRFEKILENQDLKAKAEEAKRLGIRAFALAKEKIDRALKEAKDAINK
jgi:hypothetical protein